MIKSGVIILSLVLGVAAITPAYCQEEVREKKISTVQGTISQINWVGSTIVVRWMQQGRTITYDEIAIFVPHETKITKGTNDITLGNLNICDRVIVKYYDDPLDQGPLRAISIRVVT